MKDTMEVLSVISVVLFIIAMFALGVYSCVDEHGADYYTPEINRIERRTVVEYSDTTRYCNEYRVQCFCARLRDSVQVIDHNLRCANCGRSWGRHKTWFEWQFETTPYND